MIYFASDFHFGIPDRQGSMQREARFIQWLDQVKSDATAIYLMGDLFDFWFEYRTVVPKGYARLFGKLAEIVDSGIELHLFKGNHDLWAFRYLEDEIGIKLHRKGELTQLGNKKFFLSHGDGVGPGDNGYKFLKSIFENRFNQFLYRWIHPDVGTRLGSYFSRRSRLTKLLKEGVELRRSNDLAREPIVIFSKQMAASDLSINYFIFGHVHFPEILKLSDTASCVILGDWVQHFTYAVFDGETVELKKFSETLY
ncbi:MAG: UDP-2,3-diacylglucosamine diphosphatase [Bacteroidetes bacterium]|nr:UDP-2,3-diacylglucosamine diphosphatase [Bacteroidota bacterium]